ncbi:MerR family transcriptional regulator [Gordonia iterans]|uniref:MerR family transcriptional regulator n=1 Tax=Gordonia iterans TaxID=1004901 RepID=A0A2S0KGQ4_9ACTN|nr:MerR family transcriptional regulator [Gordonia iterans]AVM00854.1 MerR family transcriptional regulator [Gordonia iterans]
MLIGDVARQSGISARMLRHYDRIGLVVPSQRTPSGYREYSGADLERLVQVESLRTLGLSLAEIGEALEEPSFSPSGLLTDLVERTRQRIADEERLLSRLLDAQASGPADWSQLLRLVPLIRGITSDRPDSRQRSALAMNDDDAAHLARHLAGALLDEAEPNAAGTLAWALRRAGDRGLDELSAALDSDDAAVRARAVAALARMDSPRATAILRAALAHADLGVAQRAALATAPRGIADAEPILVAMITAGEHDVDAAEALGALARATAAADRIAGSIVGLLDTQNDAQARLRLTQALAELRCPAATAALERLCDDDDPNVARSATYLVRLLGE